MVNYTKNIRDKKKEVKIIFYTSSDRKLTIVDLVRSDYEIKKIFAEYFICCLYFLLDIVRSTKRYGVPEEDESLYVKELNSVIEKSESKYKKEIRLYKRSNFYYNSKLNYHSEDGEKDKNIIKNCTLDECKERTKITAEYNNFHNLYTVWLLCIELKLINKNNYKDIIRKLLRYSVSYKFNYDLDYLDDTINNEPVSTLFDKIVCIEGIYSSIDYYDSKFWYFSLYNYLNEYNKIYGSENKRPDTELEDLLKYDFISKKTAKNYDISKGIIYYINRFNIFRKIWNGKDIDFIEDNYDNCVDVNDIDDEINTDSDNVNDNYELN